MCQLEKFSQFHGFCKATFLYEHSNISETEMERYQYFIIINFLSDFNQIENGCYFKLITQLNVYWCYWYWFTNFPSVNCKFISYEENLNLLLIISNSFVEYNYCWSSFYRIHCIFQTFSRLFSCSHNSNFLILYSK